MNFISLKESNFLTKGKIRYLPAERQFYLDNLQACMYVTGLFLPPTCQEDIDEIVNCALPSKVITLLHIQKALKINNFLPIEFRKEIARQWAEVTNCLTSLNRSDFPGESFFLIQEPGMYIAKHSHNIGCSQSVTFCFTLEDDSISIETGFDDWHYQNFDKKSNFTIYKKDKIEIEKSVLYPDTGKFYFEITDNKVHDSYSDKWRFFWIYDFSKYEKLPDTIKDWQKIS